MKQTPALVVLLVFGGCWDDGELNSVCPDTCYTGPTYSRNEGACRDGVPVCDQHGLVLRCEGQVLPTAEVCGDGQDSDCDGHDDDDPTLASYDPDNPCLQEGACAGTHAVCVDGVYVCQYPEGYPTAELFDGRGIDDDCNGYTDCEDPAAPSPEENLELCYTGPPETVLVGECRPGYRVCNPNTGRVECNDVTPQPEVGCDGLDQNCNGLVDDIDVEAERAQLMFFVDTSGSMMGYWLVVTDLICDYAQQNPGGSLDFGLGLIGTPDWNFSLVLQPSNPDDMCEALGSIIPMGSLEPQLSAAAAVVDPDNPLGIEWAEGAQRLFVGFTDEPAQVLDGLQEIDVLDESVEDCAATATRVFWFLTQTDYLAQQATDCGGLAFPLTHNKQWMLNDLNLIIQTTCAAGIEERTP